MDINKFLNNNFLISLAPSHSHLTKIDSDGNLQEKKGFSKVKAMVGKFLYTIVGCSDKYVNKHIARLFKENFIASYQLPDTLLNKNIHQQPFDDLAHISAIYHKVMPKDNDLVLEKCLPLILYAATAAIEGDAFNEEEKKALSAACDNLYDHTFDLVSDKTYEISHIFFHASTIEAKLADAAKPAVAVKTPLKFNVNWALDQKLKSRFDSGEDAKLLLVESINNQQTMGASWLMKKGTSLTNEEVNALNPEAKKRYEWLSLTHSNKPISAENLDHYALDVGYGYKGANLLVIESELKEVKLETCQLKVPPFLTHSDFEMQEFLLKANPQIEVKWKAFLQTFDQGLKDQYTNKSVSDTDASKVPIKITPEGAKIIGEIQQLVKDHFRNNTYHTLQIEEWLKAHPTDFLIVRSTGKEDTDTNSNAGGNDSIPFVRPDAVEISEAIGDVLSSYFGVKSVTQRLGAGDRTVFEEERPFIPVLLQVMVGENIGGVGTPNDEIPRSGVMFSSQNDKAEGVTIIQSALGNNEGVVSSTVAVDSYYVDTDNNIHSVLRKKNTRFVSVEEGGRYKAAEIENKNPALEKQAALPSAVVRDLKRVADAVSAQYSTTDEIKPMDMEYTVKLKDKGEVKPTIYLLQARPLQKMNTKSNPPSYLQLDDCEVAPAENKVMVQTLLDGQSYVRTVTKSDEVLFVNDLKEALKSYFKEKNPQNIKAIVVRKSAPSTSHESVVLRARGVLVYVADTTEEYDKAEVLIKNSREDAPVLLDPQRGLIIKGLSPQAINAGHISYPIPLEVSVPPTPMMLKGLKLAQEKDPVVRQELLESIKTAFPTFNKNIIKSIESWSGGEPLLQVKTKDTPNGYTIRGLLELMATRESKEAKIAFATLVDYLNKNLASQMKSSTGVIAGANIPKFMVLETIMEMAQKEIIPALENNNPQTLERLFHLKFLDALIFQRASKDIVSGFSYGMSTVTTAKEAALISELEIAGVNTKNLTQDQLYLFSLKDNIWNKWMQDRWISFVTLLEPKDLEVCKTFFKKLDKLNMVSTYMNLIFKDFVVGNAKKFTANVLKEIQIESNSNPIMKARLEKNMVRLAGAENQIEQWKKAKHVVKNFAAFKKEFENDFKQLITDYQKATKFEKLALLEGASRAIDIYDRTIKSLKENPEFATDQEKVKYFAELLEGYKGMMEQTLKLVPSADEQKIMQPSMGSLMSFKSYQENLDKGHKYYFGFSNSYNHTGFNTILSQARSGKGDAKHLEARPEFAVDSLIIGSKADLNFSVHWPDRLEEYFTTFHQNMEKAIQHVRMSHGLTKDILPDFAKGIVNEIEAKFGVSLSQIKQENGELKINFNIPLRQHAGALTLIVNPNHPEKGMQLEGRMFGNDEHDRWDQAASYFSYLAYSDPNLSLTNNIGPEIDYTKESREGVGFSLHLNKDFTKPEKLITKLQYIYKTMTMSSYEVPTSDALVSKWSGLDLANFPVEMSSHTLYANKSLLCILDNKKLHLKKALVAEQSLLSLAKKGLADYTKGVSLHINGYTFTPEYATLPNNQSHGFMKYNSSLVANSILCLIKANKESEETGPVIDRVLHNYDLQKAFPDQLEVLAKATNKKTVKVAATVKEPEEVVVQPQVAAIKTPEEVVVQPQVAIKTPEELFKEHLIKGEFKAAIDYAEGRKNIFLKSSVERQVINAINVAKSVDDILKIIDQLGDYYSDFEYNLSTAPIITPETKIQVKAKIKQLEEAKKK